MGEWNLGIRLDLNVDKSLVFINLPDRKCEISPCRNPKSLIDKGGYEIMGLTQKCLSIYDFESDEKSKKKFLF